MKKIATLFTIFLYTLFTFTNINPFIVHAASQQTTGTIIHSEIIPLDESTYIEVITYDNTSPQQTAARTTYSKSASKTYNIKNSSQVTLASFTLSCTFTYNGSTSTCTSASHSEAIYDSTWTFTSATASRSTNKGIGSFIAKCSATGQTVSKTLTLTCDKNGNIS